MDIAETQAELELSFTKAHDEIQLSFTRAHDELREVWPELTPMQGAFLLARYHGGYRTDQEAARALNLNPGTPYTWRWRSPAFRKAEALLGDSFLEAARAAQFVDHMRTYNERREAFSAWQEAKRARKRARKRYKPLVFSTVPNTHSKIQAL